MKTYYSKKDGCFKRIILFKMRFLKKYLRNFEASFPEFRDRTKDNWTDATFVYESFYDAINPRERRKIWKDSFFKNRGGED